MHSITASAIATTNQRQLSKIAGLWELADKRNTVLSVTGNAMGFGISSLDKPQMLDATLPPRGNKIAIREWATGNASINEV